MWSEIMVSKSWEEFHTEKFYILELYCANQILQYF